MTEFFCLCSLAHRKERKQVNELKIEFTGNHVRRNDFLEQIKESFMPFMGLDTGFMMFVWEIVKNIYDHADGKGQLTLKKEEGGENELFHFEIKDFGTQSYDLAKIKETGSTKIDSKVNFGNGLQGGMIEGMAEDLSITLRIDTSSGFCYAGTYPRTKDYATHCYAFAEEEATRSQK